MANFRYLGRELSNKTFIRKKKFAQFKFGECLLPLGENTLFSPSLRKHVNNKKYRTITLHELVMDVKLHYLR